jgi:two-component sensor histidine kinase
MMFAYPGMISIKSNAVGRVDYRTTPKTGVAARIDRSMLTTLSTSILEAFQLWSNEVVGRKAGLLLIELPANPSFPSFSPKLMCCRKPTRTSGASTVSRCWTASLARSVTSAISSSACRPMPCVRQLLVNELSHRVKNTLASLQAIAQQTLLHTKLLSDLALGFTDRIQLLARVHSLLTESTWPGTDLRSLIRDHLLQVLPAKPRPPAWGLDVHLGTQTANRSQAPHPVRPDACGEPRPVKGGKDFAWGAFAASRRHH